MQRLPGASRALLVMSSVALILTACEGGVGGSLDAPSLGLNFNNNNSNNNQSSSDGSGETENANPPQQVSGSFLTCAFVQPELQIVHNAQTGILVPLGCGLFQRGVQGAQPSSLVGLQSKVGVACPNAPATLLTASAPPAAATNLEMTVSLSPAELSCTIEVAVRDASGHTATFAKSVPTVTQVDAARGFNIAADMSAQGISLSSTPATKAGAASDGISQSASNSALADRLGHEIGGKIGASILAANQNNNNGGPLFPSADPVAAATPAATGIYSFGYFPPVPGDSGTTANDGGTGGSGGIAGGGGGGGGAGGSSGGASSSDGAANSQQATTPQQPTKPKTPSTPQDPDGGDNLCTDGTPTLAGTTTKKPSPPTLGSNTNGNLSGSATALLDVVTTDTGNSTGTNCQTTSTTGS